MLLKVTILYVKVTPVGDAGYEVTVAYLKAESSLIATSLTEFNSSVGMPVEPSSLKTAYPVIAQPPSSLG